MSFERIIVPTDYSECSMAAVNYAGSIINGEKAEVIIAHIIEIPELGPLFPMAPEWGGNDMATAMNIDATNRLLEEGKKQMQTFVSKIHLKGISIKSVVELGSPSEVINQLAHKHQAGMIVMCAHGSGGENELFIGSNTEKLIRSADFPVLTIKSALKTPKKIVFASDFSSETDVIFTQVRHLAKVIDASIHLLKVNTMEKFETTRESKAMIERFIKAHHLGTIEYSIYNDLMLESGIINFIEDYEADIIALGTHNSHLFDHMFSKSLTEELLTHCNCPVFTVNAERLQKIAA